jgi:pyruvate/2-oxoacid:ferredoxin oxidoreductase beta subunit
MSVLAVRWCAECCAEQEFEVPPCADGHGLDCPDLACTGCGAAVVLGVLTGAGDVEIAVVLQPAAA